uniref:Hexosyltransferase n=1 Tax=Haemonchus contortus TaxID=6289 RepID=A0A7I4YTK4_HAECO
MCSDGNFKKKREIIIITLLYCYFLLRLSYYTELLYLDDIPMPNQIIFKNNTINYKYLSLPNTSKCNDAKSMVVAVVLSTPEQILTRQIIRNSWASPSRSKAVRDGIITVFFIVGAPKSDIEMERLLAEQRSYQDMIVTDLMDTYENLVLKVNVMLNFFVYNCRKANYLIKVDDDVSIHLDRMLAYWSLASRNKAKIYCRLCVLCPPFRNESDKWYISRQYWGRRTYPTYCHGSFYLLGRSAAQGILRETRYFEPIPFEDVFYTGILASTAGYPRVEWSGRIIAVDEAKWHRTIECDASRNALTFAVSSFKTSNGLMAAFEHLVSFQCLTY